MNPEININDDFEENYKYYNIYNIYIIHVQFKLKRAIKSILD